jgi:hypothetical protein
MQPDVTPFFTIATTSSGSPNTAILKGALRERIRTIIRQVCKELGVQIVSGGNITDEAILQYLKYHEPTGVSR